MAKIGKKIVDLSDFGYTQPVVFKELTLGDSAKISTQLARENKRFEGNTPEAIVNMIVLECLIESAPFPVDREGLESIPLTLAVFLIEQAETMLAPLVKKMSGSSNTITAAEGPTTPTSQS